MKATAVCAVALLTSGCAAQAVKPAREARRLTIEELIEIKHPSSPMWSPDGRLVAFVWDRAGVSRVYVARADGPSAPASSPRELPGAGASLAGAFWSADGRALMVTRSGDLWRVPVDGSTASAVWTTAQAESAITPSPDGARVAFLRPVGAGGSELVVRALADGRETRIIRADDHVMATVSWSPDGQSLVVGNAPSVIRHDQTPAYSGAKIIYTINETVPGGTFVVPASGGAARPLAVISGGLGARRWLDARHFVFDRTSTDFKRRTSYLVDIGGGEPQVLHEDVKDKFWSITGDANAGAQPSPDGKWVAFVSDRDGWDHLYVMAAPDLTRNHDGAQQPLSARQPIQITRGRFEAWRPTWSPDSQRIAFDASEPDRYGDRQLYVATIAGDPDHASLMPLTSGRGTNIGPIWSPDGTRLVYQHTDFQNSADLYVIDVTTKQTIRLSDSMPASIDRARLVAPEMVHYPGPDGQQVPAWLFVPKDLDRSKKHPAIVWIHGDGVNQNYDGWHIQRNYAVYYSFHQYLLQQGYIVVAPDYRGSIGYGRDWREGVYMDVGGKDAKDAWMVANYLKTLPYVDAGRIGVWGLSYGGFFTLIAVTDQPKLFRAAVDVAGVVDYAMYYEDPYHGGWTASRIGTPEQNPRVYANASPISHVDRLETPLLVLHGTADVNVPYLHSVRLIDELMKKNKSHLVTFMTYPGEFHYFTREHVLRDAWHRVDDFFETYLKGGPAPSH
jgi:dipeptidyl aminopeptidase/acylaminoacyl peptidase